MSAQAKEDFKDLEAFTNFVIEKMKKTLPGAEAKVETVQIDGKPAKRMTMSGTLANGQMPALSSPAWRLVPSSCALWCTLRRRILRGRDPC